MYTIVCTKYWLGRASHNVHKWRTYFYSLLFLVKMLVSLHEWFKGCTWLCWETVCGAVCKKMLKCVKLWNVLDKRDHLQCYHTATTLSLASVLAIFSLDIYCHYHHHYHHAATITTYLLLPSLPPHCCHHYHHYHYHQWVRSVHRWLDILQYILTDNGSLPISFELML